MSKKNLAILFALVVGGVGAFFYYYFLIENKYNLELSQRGTDLQNNILEFKKNSACVTSTDQISCFKDFVAKNNFVLYNSDFTFYFALAVSMCQGKVNSYCVFELMDQVVSAFNVQSYVALQDARHYGKKAAVVLSKEIKSTDRFLRNHRKKMVTYFETENDVQRKSNLLKFVASVDEKIGDLQKKTDLPN